MTDTPRLPATAAQRQPSAAGAPGAAAPADPDVECMSCDWRGAESDAANRADFWLHVEPGDTVPAGHCPQCGAHVFIDDARSRLQDAAPALRDALQTLMLRWGDYVFMANATGESKEYVDQAIRYGKRARAVLATLDKREG